MFIVKQMALLGFDGIRNFLKRNMDIVIPKAFFFKIDW
jgi:hypothetical protein